MNLHLDGKRVFITGGIEVFPWNSTFLLPDVCLWPVSA